MIDQKKSLLHVILILKPKVEHRHHTCQCLFHTLFLCLARFSSSSTANFNCKIVIFSLMEVVLIEYPQTRSILLKSHLPGTCSNSAEVERGSVQFLGYCIENIANRPHKSLYCTLGERTGMFSGQEFCLKHHKMSKSRLIFRATNGRHKRVNLTRKYKPSIQSFR